MKRQELRSARNKGWASLLLALAMLLVLIGQAWAERSETVTYYHTDGLGSVIAASDENGNLLWRERYRPFGERLEKAVSTDEHALYYTGKPHDEAIGLTYFGARHYDPVVGRFMSIDPAGVDPGNLHSFNRYAYANNNPYRYVDPDGNLPILVPFAVFLAKEIGAEAFERATGLPALFSVTGAAKAAGKKLVKSGAKGAVGRTITRTPNEAGVVREFVTEADQTFYRVFSGDNSVGGFVTAVKPKSSAFAQEALALPRLNRADQIQEVMVPAGTKLRRSRAAPIRASDTFPNRRGGAEQFELLDRIPTGNFGSGSPLR